MWPKRYEQKETQKHKKVKMDDRNNETNWKNIMNIQQCCKLGNLGSLIGWESSGLQRTQIGLWRKHCIASARWLLLFLEGTKNTKEEYFVFGILTQCHGNDVNSCGCESAKIFRFLFFDLWFMCFDEIWWDMMICRIVSPIPLCGAIAVRHGWQKLPTLEQCWSLTQHRCKSQPFWPFRDRLKIQGDGHNGNNQHNRQHTHTHITISQKNAQTSKSKRDDVCSIFPDFWPSHFSRSLVSFWVSEPVRIFCFQRIPGYLISRSQGEELLARLDTLHAFLSRMTWQKAEGHDMTGLAER